MAARKAARGALNVECQECGQSFYDDGLLRRCPGCGVDFLVGRGPRAVGPKERTVDSNVVGFPVDNKPTAEGVAARKTLDRLEKELEKLVADGGTVQWQIGQRLQTIWSGDLWQLGDFKSFRDYVVTRWEFTVQTAMAYMRIAGTFTEKEAATFGLSEMTLLSKVKDDEERAKLADRIRKEEPSFRELAAMVKESRQKAGERTVRPGTEDSIPLSGRVKVGVYAEGGWKQKGEKMFFEFEIGGARIRLEDIPEDKKKKIAGGWVLKVLGASRDD